MAAILACGPGACLASLNAAVHMRLWRRRVTGIYVLVPTRHRGLEGVRCSASPPGRARRHTPRRDPGDHGAAHAGRPQRRADPAPARERDPRGRVPQAVRRARRARRDAQGQRPPQPERAREGARAQRGRQRGHAQRARRPLPRSYKQIRPGRTAREHQNRRPRGRLPLAAPEPDRRSRRPRPHPPAHQTRTTNETPAYEPPATTSYACPPTRSTSGRRLWLHACFRGRRFRLAQLEALDLARRPCAGSRTRTRPRAGTRSAGGAPCTTRAARRPARPDRPAARCRSRTP